MRLLATLLLAVHVMPAKASILASSSLALCDANDEAFGLKCDNKLILTMSLDDRDAYTERMVLDAVVDDRDASSGTFGEEVGLVNMVEITVSKVRPVLRYGLQFLRYVNWGPFEMETDPRRSTSPVPGKSAQPDCQYFVPFVDESTRETIVGGGICCFCRAYSTSKSVRRTAIAPCKFSTRTYATTSIPVMHPTWASVYRVLPPVYEFYVQIQVSDPSNLIFTESDGSTSGAWEKVDDSMNTWQARVSPKQSQLLLLELDGLTDRDAQVDSPMGTIELTGNFAPYQAVPLLTNTLIARKSHCQIVNVGGNDLVRALYTECLAQEQNNEFLYSDNWLALPEDSFGNECDKIGVDYDDWVTGETMDSFCKELPNTCLQNQLSDFFEEKTESGKRAWSIESRFPTLDVLGGNTYREAELWKGPSWNSYPILDPPSDEDLRQGNYDAYFDARTAHSLGASVVTLQLSADRVLERQTLSASGSLITVLCTNYNKTSTQEPSVVVVNVRNNGTALSDFEVAMTCQHQGQLIEAPPIVRTIRPHQNSQTTLSVWNTDETGRAYACEVTLRDLAGTLLDTVPVEIAFADLPPAPESTWPSFRKAHSGNTGTQESVENNSCAAQCASAWHVSCQLAHGCGEGFLALFLILGLTCAAFFLMVHMPRKHGINKKLHDALERLRQRMCPEEESADISNEEYEVTSPLTAEQPPGFDEGTQLPSTPLLDNSQAEVQKDSTGSTTATPNTKSARMV
ncbi:MAG: hypothetical protein MHM6MM_001265 [Cercozoa sp. M6MM]